MQAELAALREEVRALRSELSSLRASVEALNSAVGLTAEPDTGEAGTGSGASWEAVSPRGLENEQVPAATTAAGGSGYPQAISSNNTLRVQSWEECERICGEIGEFIALRLLGRYPADSGRSKITLRSRFWLVARDCNGRDFDPPKIYTRWSAALACVKREESFGRSIFVGLPSERECRAVVYAAGLRWPTQFEV